MHELPFTKGIHKTVLRKAESVGATHVNRVVLEIGVLHDFIPEFVQRYWDFISQGTITEGSLVEIRWKNALVMCGRCNTQYEVDKDGMLDPRCPQCGFEFGTTLSGNEMRIIGIEIVRTPSRPPLGGSGHIQKGEVLSK